MVSWKEDDDEMRVREEFGAAESHRNVMQRSAKNTQKHHTTN